MLEFQDVVQSSQRALKGYQNFYFSVFLYKNFLTSS